MAEAKTWKNMGNLSGKPGKPGILTKIKSGHPVDTLEYKGIGCLG